MDFTVTEGLNDWGTASRIVEAAAEFLAQDGVLLLLGLVCVVFFAGGRRGASAAGFSAVIALGIGQVVSGAADRARPFVVHPQIHLLIHHARDAGFPSDHATGSFAIAAALLLRHRRAGSAAMALACLIGLSRVVVGAHYATDIVGGALLGSAVALVLWISPLRRLTDAVGDGAGALFERATKGLRAGPPSSRRGQAPAGG
jgi:undecaprenyl-diphosphatase